MNRVRTIFAVVVAVVATVVVLQNTESVETSLLFTSVTAPKAVLLLVAALIGFFFGVLASRRLIRRPD